MSSTTDRTTDRLTAPLGSDELTELVGELIRARSDRGETIRSPNTVRSRN